MVKIGFGTTLELTECKSCGEKVADFHEHSKNCSKEDQGSKPTPAKVVKITFGYDKI